MRAIKTLIFFLAVALLGVTAANRTYAQCGGTGPCDAGYSQNSVQTRSYKKTYVKRVSHNSQDDAYENQRLEEEIRKRNDYNAFGTPQNARAMSNMNYNPKDGSIFPGGRCDNCTKDGSIFPGGRCSIPKGQCFKACRQNCSSPMKGSCERACKPCFSCSDTRITSIKEKQEIKEDKVYKSGFVQNYVVAEDEIYDAIHKCKDSAPLELKYVDFRIKKDRKFSGFSNKLGNYRFRIFGCRRFDKHATLNQGRIIQKDLQFIRIFDDMVSDCYNVVKTPNDLCVPGNDKPIPEYVLTAEITDYFMNLCDKYDWDEAKKEELRTGSSEMTVTWRLTDVTGKNVLWKGESVGYAEVEEGEYNGEIVLIERAFADAVNSLRSTPGFNEQLSKRVKKEDLDRARQDLIELEKIANPVKCQFQEEIQIAEEKKCGVQTICQDINTCTGEVVKETVKEKEVLVIEKETPRVDENSGHKSTGDFVTEDGGSNSSASISEKKETIIVDENSGFTETGSGAIGQTTEKTFTEVVIDENSGVSSSGSGGIDETYHTTVTDVIIDETSGFSESGSGGIGDGSRTEKTDSMIDENSGVYSSGSGNLQDGSSSQRTETMIDENSGVYSSGSGNMQDGSLTEKTETMIDENFGVYSSGSGNTDDIITFEIVDSVDENSGSYSSGSEFSDELWIDVPLDKDSSEVTKGVRETAEQGFADDADSLCIVDRPPYDTLSAENVYRVRASIVSIANANGKKGSGLIISDQFILTSADLITKERNSYDIETINGLKLKATAFRINPNKNIALLLLDEKTKYTPLSLNLDLPPTGKSGFLTLGLLDFNQAEGRLENKAKVAGYRFSDETGAEIIVDTNVQKTSVGGALIDEHGTISGIAHTEKTTLDNNDLFMPISNAIKSVGLSICDKPFPEQTPWYDRAVTPVSDAIDNYKPVAPEAMDKKERK